MTLKRYLDEEDVLPTRMLLIELGVGVFGWAGTWVALRDVVRVNVYV